MTRFWTRERLDEFERMWLAGAKITDIATWFGKGRGAICSARRYYMLPERKTVRTYTRRTAA